LNVIYSTFFCSYEATGNENQVKMHRSISSGDVRKYSTGTRVKDVQLEKEEDIEYHSGHLYHSSGLTTVKMARRRVESRRVTLPDGPLNDELLSANGSYTLDLLRCYTLSSVTRGRRSARKPMTRGSLEAVVDKSNFISSSSNVEHVDFVWMMNIILTHLGLCRFSC